MSSSFLTREQRHDIVIACERVGCTDARVVTEVLMLAEEQAAVAQTLDLLRAGRVVPMLDGDGEVRFTLSAVAPWPALVEVP